MNTHLTSRPSNWLLSAVLALLVLICALFTFVATCVLFVVSWQRGGPGLAMTLAKLSAKGLFFGFVTLLSAYALFRLARKAPHNLPEETMPDHKLLSARSIAALLCVLALTALLIFPRLDKYPRPEPDETHHLIVARNLAEYGLYASGHPDTAFNILDDYDSVGPVVILPVAASLRLFGTAIIPPRITMALFFLALCATVYGFSFRLFGPTASALATLMTLAAWGSVYLARSLYGEVPALLFMLLGLLVWRHALTTKRFSLALLAGILFGMAVLCKAFMINSAWAFLGALIYDRMTYRRITLRPLVATALGTLAVMGAWWFIQKAYQQSDVDIAVDTLNVYRQYLMFGIRSVHRPLLWLLKQPATLLTSLLAFIFVAPVVFQKRYDPPSIVLFLFAPFMTYWWLFFTSGSHPRYTWYTGVLAGIFTAALAGRLLQRLRQTAPPWLLAGLLLPLTLILAPPFARTLTQARLVFTADETQDERALAAYIRSLPQPTNLATTVWPLERALNFLTGRNVNRLNGFINGQCTFDIVIAAPDLYDTPDGLGEPSQTFGKYVVFEPNRH